MHIIGAHASPMRSFRETVGRQVASSAPLPSQQGGGGKSGLESCPAPRACLCSLHAPASLVPRALERGLTGRGSLPMGRSRRQHPIFRSAPTECRGDPDPQGPAAPAPAPTPAAAPAGDPAPSDPTAPKFAGYDKIAVVNPPNDGTVWDNSGNVSIEIAVAPALQGTLGHKLVVLLNGQPLGEPIAATSFTVANLDRNTYTLQARIVDADGKVLGESPPSVFHMKRISVAPAAPPAASPATPAAPPAAPPATPAAPPAAPPATP
jgi:hypothetical protein